MTTAPATDNASVAMECESMFLYFNRRLFGNSLPVPSFVVNPRKRGFRFVPEHQRLMIGISHGSSEISDLAMEMLREMIYIRNYSLNRSDHTTNHYHNHFFAEVAVGIGFYVSRHESRGFSILSWSGGGKDDYVPDEETRTYLDGTVRRFSALSNIVDLFNNRIESEKGNRKLYQLRYVCNCKPPHNSIRSGRRPGGKHPLKCLCLDCNQPYRVASED